MEEPKNLTRDEYPVYVKYGIFKKCLIGTARVDKWTEDHIEHFRIITNINPRYLPQTTSDIHKTKLQKRNK